ncbi:MAG TPA: DHH family phosphoesterase, partial [Candidatus Kapabacteria bacterium]|nr:DHH family phosphoesterase [Candidatus Kapabacteria bacterium]
MRPIAETYPLLAQPHRVAIVMHQKPDADAMGSSLALSLFLRKLGHRTTVISPTNWAEWLKWMPDCANVIDFEFSTEKAMAALEQAEWLFCLDFNTLSRTRHMAPRLRKLAIPKFLIDHHQQPESEIFSYGISDTEKSSTCEMVYDFIVGSGNAGLIDVDIAACLYAGVMTDTGSFRFPAASAAVHRMVAALKDTGLNHT